MICSTASRAPRQPLLRMAGLRRGQEPQPQHLVPQGRTSYSWLPSSRAHNACLLQFQKCLLSCNEEWKVLEAKCELLLDFSLPGGKQQSPSSFVVPSGRPSSICPPYRSFPFVSLGPTLLNGPFQIIPDHSGSFWSKFTPQLSILIQVGESPSRPVCPAGCEQLSYDQGALGRIITVCYQSDAPVWWCLVFM